MSEIEKLRILISSILQKKPVKKLIFSDDRALVVSTYLAILALLATFLPTDSALVVVRWITTLPFLLTAPGYSIIRVVYPKELDPEVRWGMAIITSLAVMPIAGVSLFLGRYGLSIAVAATGALSLGLQILAKRSRTLPKKENKQTKNEQKASDNLRKGSV